MAHRPGTEASSRPGTEASSNSRVWHIGLELRLALGLEPRLALALGYDIYIGLELRLMHVYCTTGLCLPCGRVNAAVL